MTEYKAVKITGGAIADFQRKKTRKRKVNGGDAPLDQVEEHSFRNANITKITGGATAIAPVTLPVVAPSFQNPIPLSNSIQTPLLPQQQPQPQQQGGVKHIRVELKKKQSKKVNLHPKREISKINGNVKKTRKFVLGVSSFHKRMNRAKKMQRTVKAMPIDKLREHLINAKLIKKTSKAPESILRQIAEDSQLVGKHIL
jgi:hypothetical protein